MREGGREATVGAVRKSGLSNDGRVYANRLLPYWIAERVTDLAFVIPGCSFPVRAHLLSGKD